MKNKEQGVRCVQYIDTTYHIHFIHLEHQKIFTRRLWGRPPPPLDPSKNILLNGREA